MFSLFAIKTTQTLIVNHNHPEQESYHPKHIYTKLLVVTQFVMKYQMRIEIKI